MRRPRSKLEVSTFPFLAVLLCAMGSLLLLLFIMDRRAKVAAQNNARETIAVRKKRSQDEEDARIAAWEKAKEQLHQALLLQQEQLAVEANGVNEKLDNVTKGIVLVQARNVELDQQLKDEKNKIAAIQGQIAQRRDALKTAETKETMSKAELLEATKELAELELAFMMMKSLKEREKEIYSVVPYRGKRGDMRPPIYIECVGSGVIFHPEKKTLPFWEIRPEAMRDEVERQAGPLRARQAILEKGQSITKGPYVLFLIRPEGITNYYKAQAALRGYQVDFGYELVDENWVLDFTLDPYAKSPAQPNSLKGPMANVGGGFGTSSISGNTASGGGPYSAGSGNPIGGAPGNNGYAPAVGPRGPYPGPGGNASSPPYPGNGGSSAANFGPPPLVGIQGNGAGGGFGIGPAGNSLLPPPPIGVNPGGTGFGVPGSVSLPPPPGLNPGTPGFGGPVGGNPNGNPAGLPGFGAPGVGPNTPQGAGGTGALASTQPPAGDPSYPATEPKNPSFMPIARVYGSNTPAAPGNPHASPTPGTQGPDGMTTPQMIASAGPTSSSGNPPATTGGAGSQQAPGTNIGNVPGSGGNASNGPAARGPASNGQGASGPASNGQGASGSPGDGDGSPGMPGPRPLPNYGAVQPRKTAAPSPLSKLLGNKDFLITIDCFGDHVNVFPGGTLHRWTQANTQAADQLLVQTVTNLIARRQASVRPGEPPYQPLIRFQVSPDGLRTYYHAYPLLEHLRVPMSRENIVE